MTKLTLRETQFSKVDRTQKLIYTLERLTGPVTIEVGAIQKGDGKNILCIPTQTNCAQACRFCHTTEMAGKVAVSNLTGEEMREIVRMGWVDASFTGSRLPLLVSFMGVGEPAANTPSLLRAMMLIQSLMEQFAQKVRFGLATMLPARHLEDFHHFASLVAVSKLPLKVHLSLHYPYTSERKEWMPASASVAESLAELQRYRKVTKNPVEIHYTLIAGVNDTFNRIHELRRLIEADPIPVKFMQYNPLPGDPLRSPDPEWTDFLRSQLENAGIPTEYYASPGADIQAACGMFLADAYIPTKRLQTAPSLQQVGLDALDHIHRYNFPDLVKIHPLPPSPEAVAR